MPSTRQAQSKAKSKSTATLGSNSKSQTKDPKQSHLYTDDNPSTTLHGTGFKDSDTAHRTITLVSRRSLTYQWQVINTMYHRAKSHPAMRKGGDSAGGMKDAMAIFRDWLDDTYPTAKERRKQEGREFKPLLSKELVKKYLTRIKSLTSAASELGNEHEKISHDAQLDSCQRFAEMYVNLHKGKRLANTLVDDAHPEREDWEIVREQSLAKLRMQRNGKGEEDLWNERGGASEWHLQCIGWAWSPVGERRLPP